MWDLDFNQQTALVTGAAHGIGRAICVELARRRARVWASDVLPADLDDTRRACESVGAPCRTTVVDVTRPDQIEAWVGEALSATGRIDILVNVAGGVVGQVGKPLEEVSDAEWRAVMDVNLSGTFHCCQAVAPAMKERGYGRIVNISSGAGRSVSLTGIQAYASAKAGQIGLTRQLAHELGPRSITVNTIAPGFIRSNPATERQWESYGEEGQRRLVESMALKRLGHAEDIANGVLFFASDLASWCTGQVLSIDGGKALF